MAVYLGMFVVMFLIQFIPVQSARGYDIRLFFTFLILFLYGAFRVDYGLDYDSYELLFENINAGNLDSRIEIGYTFLNQILPSFRLVLIVTSAFTCIAYFYLFRLVIPSNWTWLAILLFFLAGNYTIFFMFSGIRNAISVAIMIFSIGLIRDRKWWWYLIVVAIASCFHISSLLFMTLAYLPISKRITNIQVFLWISIVALLIVLPSSFMFNLGSTLISGYFDMYSIYMDNAMVLGDTRSILTLCSSIYMFSYSIIFLMYNNLRPTENTILYLSMLFILAPLLGALNFRFTHCFAPFFVVAMVVIFRTGKNNIWKYIYLCFVLAYLGYSFFQVFMKGYYFTYWGYNSLLFSI